MVAGNLEVGSRCFISFKIKHVWVYVISYTYCTLWYKLYYVLYNVRRNV